jgi:hypothetical protein
VPAFTPASALDLISPQSVAHIAAASFSTQLSTINCRLSLPATITDHGSPITIHFPMPGIVNEIALSSAASVVACSGVSSTSGVRTVRHAGSSA